MKLSSLALRVVAAGMVASGLWAGLFAGLGCLKVVYVDKPCDGGGVIVPVEPLHAQVLYVLDLDRGAVNMTGSYAGIVNRLHEALALEGIAVDEHAILPLYGSATDTPTLVWGRPAQNAGDLSAALGPLASSGAYDAPLAGVTAESSNPALIAASLDSATLPPEVSPDQSRPFFSPPKDLFIIATVAPTRRLCALTADACLLGGRTPDDAFAATNQDGTAAWLKLPGGTYRKNRVYQVFIATSEVDSPNVYRAKCSADPGFPKGLLDVIEPSPVRYYTDLAAELTKDGWRAETLDFCDVLAATGDILLRQTAKRISQAAGT